MSRYTFYATLFNNNIYITYFMIYDNDNSIYNNIIIRCRYINL